MSCTAGQPPFVPQYPIGASGSSENVLNPKVSLAWHPDKNNEVYATAAKGFRPGGGQLALPTQCNGFLAAVGYTPTGGAHPVPGAFKSDSLWSYEVGTKNSLFGGLIQLDGSAYLIKWKNVQTQITVAGCGYGFVDNVADATSRGFDMKLDLHPLQGMVLGTSVGYNRSTFDEASAAFRKDSPLPTLGSPWNIYVYGQYDRPISPDVAGYLRVDYTHTSQYVRVGRTDPLASNYDPLLPPNPATNLVNGRLGVRLNNALDVSLFANNVFNAAPHLAFSHSKNDFYWTDESFRPRTIGLNASFKY